MYRSRTLQYLLSGGTVIIDQNADNQKCAPCLAGHLRTMNAISSRTVEEMYEIFKNCNEREKNNCTIPISVGETDDLNLILEDSVRK
jgi:hypothetical protein